VTCYSIGKQGAPTSPIDALAGKGDMTLVAAAKQGNREPFGVLVERHEQRLFFFARRMTRNRQDAGTLRRKAFKRLSLTGTNSQGNLPFRPG
jgi:hypothetical protein